MEKQLELDFEYWKPIEGYEGLYEVSDRGRVRSLERIDSNNVKRGGFIKSCIKDKYGYFVVHLSKNGKEKMHKVHRLVATAFIQNPNNFQQVNHKDEDKTNNSVENLEWCTSNYNYNYGTRIKRQSITQSKPVRCIETGIIYYGACEASRIMKINQGHISDCCNGKRKSCGGYHFEFAA